MLASRQDQQQLVVHLDGFVDLLVDFLAALDIVRREPAADALRLQIGVKAVGEVLVLGGVADEAGVEVEGRAGERLHVRDEVLGDACAAKEDFGDLALAAVDGVDADGGGAVVLDACRGPLHYSDRRRRKQGARSSRACARSGPRRRLVPYAGPRCPGSHRYRFASRGQH